jgi:hypothetical protein
MSIEVMLTLPDKSHETATRWAALTRHDVPKTLTDALTIVLSPRTIPLAPAKPLSTLSDAEATALCRTDPGAEAGRRVDVLSEKQREGTLKSRERQELLALMQEHDQRRLRQSEALAEAVRHGLRAA